MRILNRYIASYVIFATIFVTLVFLGIQTFMSFVEQLSDIGAQHYRLIQSVQFVLLNLPSNFYKLFPVIGLLGSLLGLGYLASSNQLVVMQSSGISIFKITWAVIRATLFMLIFATFVGEVFAPVLKSRALDYKAQAMKKGVGLAVFHGAWLHYQNDFIYIGGFVSPTKINKVVIYSLDQMHKLNTLYYAKRGHLKDGRWWLSDIVRTSFYDKKVVTEQISKFPLNVDIQPKMLAAMVSDPDTLTLNDSYQYMQYFARYNLNTFLVNFNFWQRIIQPLTTIVMIALSIPFIFGSLRRVSTGCRIVVGIIVGLGFYILNQVVGPITLLFQLPPWFGAIVPTAVFLLICLWLLFCVKR